MLPKANGIIDGSSKEAIPVVFSSRGLPFDTYKGELCLISNDPAVPVSSISLEMSVQETAAFVVFLPVVAMQ